MYLVLVMVIQKRLWKLIPILISCNEKSHAVMNMPKIIFRINRTYFTFAFDKWRWFISLSEIFKKIFFILCLTKGNMQIWERILHYTFELYLRVNFNREDEKYEVSAKIFSKTRWLEWLMRKQCWWPNISRDTTEICKEIALESGYLVAESSHNYVLLTL